MSQWVPQNEFLSITAASRCRTAYLRPIISAIVEAVENYLNGNPSGENVTLAVLEALGQQRLKTFTKDKPFERVKQDMELLVAQTLVDLFGAMRVQTFRRLDRKSMAARRNAWPQLPWVNSYAPHRVLPATLSAERILLDTSVVRKIVHADADALDVQALARVKGQHLVSIADGALAELAHQLLRRAIAPADWQKRIAELDSVLDPDFPLAPGGKELAVMWGAHSPIGLDLGEARAYYRASWRYLCSVRKPEDLTRRAEFSAPSGRRYAIRLDAEHVNAVLAAEGGRWADWVDTVSGLLMKSRAEGDHVTEYELYQLMLSNLMLDMGVADAMKLDLVMHVLAKRAIQASTGKTPYRPKGDHNDPLDLNLLFGIPLPAWIVTADLRLHRLVRSTASKDKTAVMTSEELLNRLDRESPATPATSPPFRASRSGPFVR